MIFPIGNETVGLGKTTPVLDGDGNPIVSELMEPEMTTSVVPKTGCGFEVQLAATTFVKEAEDVTATTTSAQRVAWAHLPPDDDTTAMKLGENPHYFLQYPYPGGDNYDLRMVVVENNMQGLPDHVFVLCESQQG